MRFSQSSFGRPYSSSLDWCQFGLSVISTLLSAASGWLLVPWLGIVGFYLPLLISVALITWLGGLWPSLLAQILGAGTALFLTGHWTGALVRVADLYAVFAFLVVAKLTMFLLLNVRLNRHLQRNQSNLEMITQSTHDALWEWDFATNHVWRSGKAAEIFGCAKEEIQPNFDWGLKRVHPGDEERVWSSLRHSIESGEDRWFSEYRLRRNDGTYATVSDHGFIIRNKKGVGLRMFGGMADISAQRTAEEHLVHSAGCDALTGLLNREALMAHLDRLLKKRRYKQDGSLLAILFIDIDRFKRVNDGLGHPSGDLLLTAIAARLTRCLRQSDMAARFGGDEFVVLLDGVETSAEAVHVAERVQQSLSVPFEVDGQPIRISASIGISFAESMQAEEAVRHADLAMYQAKAQGRACFQIFEPTLETRARYASQAEIELRQSFHDGSLQLYYQPIVSLKDGKLFGFEALLRWQHPKRGLINPGEVLPLAEEAGLSAQLGRWVVRTSCECLGRWKHLEPAASSVVLSFNISGKELTRPALIEEVQEVLRDTQLDGKFLTIEVTETGIMETDMIVLQNLRRLGELGIGLAIDDFGRGYSSLGRLQDFPVSMLKIDSSFISQIGKGKCQVLDAIIALGHKLRLAIVAEGVETTEQLEYLRESQSEFGQGFLFSTALSEQNAYELLSKKHSWTIESIGRSVSITKKSTAAG